MIRDCHIIEFPRFDDHRGSLSFAEGKSHVPFDIQRIYYLYNIPSGVQRGAHGHRALEQVILAMSGSFDVTLDDGRSKVTHHLSQPDRGLYVSPMMWRNVDNFSAGAVCLVLASAPYDEADYYRDYNEFLSVAMEGLR